MYRYLLIFLVGFASLFYSLNISLYREPFAVSYWQNVYAHSQYCVPNCEFKGNIDDPELYTLAGVRYLEGIDPGILNPEVQPLAKYAFGVSTLLFGNALPVQLLFALGIFALLYFLSLRLLPPTLSLLPLFLISFDPLLLDQLKRPFVDLSVTFFLLLGVLFLVRRRYQLDWWWGGVSLGCLALVKSFSLGILFGLIIGMVILTEHKKSGLLLYLKILIVALVVYILGYLPYFIHGHSPLDFVQLHVDIIRLYRSYVPEYPKGEIFRIIVTGEWRTWWGDKGLIPSPFYSPLWALSTLSLILSYLSPIKADQKTLRIILLTIVVWLLFLSLRLVFPRYLLPVLPLLYLMLTYVGARIIAPWLLPFSRSILKRISISKM